MAAPMNAKRLIGLALGGAMLLAGGMAQSQPAGPPAGYKIDSEYTVKSPDGATVVEQYSKTDADGDYTWQFWARHGGTLTMLPPEQPDYSAGFRFTANSQWLVRMQKTGSGESSLYLYPWPRKDLFRRRQSRSAISPGPTSIAVPTRERSASPISTSVRTW